MLMKKKPGKVIDISGKLSGGKKRGKATDKPVMRIIAVTSGKGGVGKTSITANLAFALGNIGKRVLVLDADLGLGNLDVLLGITPRYNLSHVINGEKDLDSIITAGPGNMNILPAASGVQELTLLTKKQKKEITQALNRLNESFDILLIDTAAGISSNVMYFNLTAQEIFVVVTPELTSITDAYALMKVLSMNCSRKEFRLLVNMAKNSREAYEVYKQLCVVTERFLDISISYIGFVLLDQNVGKGISRQRIVSDLFPDSRASRCISSLAEQIGKWPPFFSPDVGNKAV